MASSPISVRKVVTAFIRKSEKEVLLLKRSDKVRTFPHHWAGISGGIEKEESPLECVKREIKEETHLDYNLGHIQLVRSGRPLRVDAASNKYNSYFLVHPFLFQLQTPEENIKIDWEHTEFKFVDPVTLKDYNTVPNLVETYERVHVNSETEHELNAIRDNKSEGAAALARQSLSIPVHFSKRFQQKYTTNQGQGQQLTEEQLLKRFIAELKNLAYHISNIRPTMAPIRNTALSVVAKTLLHSANTEDLINHLEANVKDMERELGVCGEKIAHHFKEIIPHNSTVLTHSYSGTVTQALAQSGQNLNVIVTESRPLFEGRKTAQLLIQRKLGSQNQPSIQSVSLCPDAAIAHVLNQTEKPLHGCVVGADSILPDGSVVNKTGTHLIALACKEANKPMYVLCDTWKIRDSEEEMELEHGSREELLGNDNNLNNQVNVINPTFERTAPFVAHAIGSQPRLLTEKDHPAVIITERGVTSLEDIKSIAKQYEKDMELVLNDEV